MCLVCVLVRIEDGPDVKGDLRGRRGSEDETSDTSTVESRPGTRTQLIEASLQTSLDQNKFAVVVNDDVRRWMVSMGKVLPFICHGGKRKSAHNQIGAETQSRKDKMGLTSRISELNSSPQRLSSCSLSGLVLMFLRSCLMDCVCCSLLTFMCMVRSWFMETQRTSHHLQT